MSLRQRFICCLELISGFQVFVWSFKTKFFIYELAHRLFNSRSIPSKASHTFNLVHSQLKCHIESHALHYPFVLEFKIISIISNVLHIPIVIILSLVLPLHPQKTLIIPKSNYLMFDQVHNISILPNKYH